MVLLRANVLALGYSGCRAEVIDTLIATNTPNSSSQRLGAIVHTAVFDAYNGIERRYTPVFVHDEAPAGASVAGEPAMSR